LRYMKKYPFLILTVLLLIFNSAQAEEELKTLESIEVLTGYGWGELKYDKDYHLYPLIIDFDLNLKKLTSKIGFTPPMLMQFQLETFISGVSQPHSNVEAGGGFALKIGILPESFALQPYIKAGTGMLYMSQHTHAQGTQFNFYEYGGAGAHWFINKNIALTAEYRFRHVSNAGLSERNGGINTSFALAGISYRF